MVGKFMMPLIGAIGSSFEKTIRMKRLHSDFNVKFDNHF
jgi:hypothetical protein